LALDDPESFINQKLTKGLLHFTTPSTGSTRHQLQESAHYLFFKFILKDYV